jgi:hypothetical protein
MSYVDIRVDIRVDLWYRPSAFVHNPNNEKQDCYDKAQQNALNDQRHVALIAFCDMSPVSIMILSQ